MKTITRIISLLMVALMLTTSVPFTPVSAVDVGTENYTLNMEKTYADSSLAESSAVGSMSFFGSAEFEGCYGNQLSGVARELYDSLVKNYIEDKITGEFTHTFETPFTFVAEISGGSIVMNDELEEVDLEIGYAMQAAMDAFLYDHPEVFWLRIIGSSYGVSASGNDVSGYTGIIDDITIIPTEIYSGASSKLSQYESAVDSVIDAITVTESRYDTLKNIHDYICNNAWYNLVSEQRVHSSEPFFIGDGGVVCEGYAKTFKILCDRLEIPCVLVSGDAGGAHMWNYVQMDDGKWYLVDATWDDQESKIYDTYFLANANTIGFNDVAICEERTERTDFSGTGIFSFTYPVLSATAYTVHVHEWESDYIVDVEPTCTEKGSKSIHCKTCEVTKDVIIIDVSHIDSDENGECDICGNIEIISRGECGDRVEYTLYSNGVLKIFGSGSTYDYENENGYTYSPFYNNLKIKKIIIEEGITCLGKKLFQACRSATSIVIPDTVNEIKSYAFKDCYKLNDISLGSGIKQIANDSFNDTDFYKNEDNWIDSILYIGDYLIKAENTIEGLCEIKDETKFVARNSFNGCSKITKLIIPDTVERIGEYAFDNCTGITEVSLPCSVETGSQAFYGCKNIELVKITKGTGLMQANIFPWSVGAKTITVFLEEGITNIGPYAFASSKIKEINIPGSVTTIEEHAFSGSAITSIIIPNNVTEIESYAFESSKVVSVYLSNNLRKIGVGAFYYCRLLEEIIIPESVIEIDSYAFQGCKMLSSFFIPKDVKYIGSSAFSECSNLSEIIVSSDNTNYCTIEGVLFDVEKTTLIQYPAGKNDEDYVIPYGVETIENSAFTSCGFLKSVTIPISVMKICYAAFCACNSLEVVNYFGLESDWENIYIGNVNTPLLNAKWYHVHSELDIPRKEPTCQEDGFTSGKKCSVCGDYLVVSNRLDALGHDMNTWLKNEDGTHSRICERDNCNYIETENCTYGEWITTKSATCTEAGSKSKSCTVCGYTVAEAITTLPHASDTAVIENRVEPECEVKGSYDEVVYCLVCDTELSREGKEIPALDHNWDNGVINPISTCKTHGTKTYTCLNNVSHKKTEQVALDSSNHEGGIYVKDAVEATCTKGGYTGDTYCLSCNKRISIGENVDVLSHSDANADKYCDICNLYLSSVVKTGSCGSNAKYTFYSDGMLIISGTGAMTNYQWNNSPFRNMSITDIVVEEGITRIGDFSFSGETIKTIKIPSTLTCVGNAALIFCTGIEKIYAVNLDSWLKIEYVFDEVGWGPEHLTYDLYFSNQLVEDVIIPSYIYTVKEYAFYGCKSIKNLTINDGVKIIKDCAFDECTNLTNIAIGRNVISMGEFYSCNRLVNILVDENNQYYSSDEFGVLYNKDKSKLIRYPVGNERDTYVIPDSVKIINDSAFLYGNNISKLIVSEDNKYYSSDDSGVLFNKYKTTLILYPSGNKRESYSVPNSVTTIRSYAFSYCDSLTSIIIPDSVINIEFWAFPNCDRLDSIYYSGTKEQWETICDSSDETLMNVIVYYDYCAHNDKKIYEREEPTCVDVGYTEGVFCEECETWLIGHEEILSIGHAWDEGIVISEATCKNYGTKLYVCFNDENHTKTEQVGLDSNNHIAETYILNKIDASCMSNGYTGDVYCSDCCAMISEGIVIDSVGHDEIIHESKIPTCKSKGWDSYVTCSRCNYSTYVEIPATGHDFQSIVTQPTCTIKGYTTYLCVHCEEFYVDNFIEANGHNYSSYEVIKNPTCSTEGLKERLCADCNNVDVAIIAKLGHNYSSNYTVDKKPTCTDKGVKSRHCTRCSSKTGEAIVEAIGHNYGTYTMNTPSCTTKGSIQRTCSVCQNVEKTVIEKLGHNYSANYTVDKKATCTAEGSKSKHCTRDGCTAKTSVTVIKKLSHTYKTTVTKTTLSKNGNSENKCTACGHVSKTTVIYAPKTIKLSATSYTYNGKVKTPSITVKDSKGKKLKNGTDYTVKYSKGRKSIGKYTVTVTFKGNYSGTKKPTFEIVPAKVTLSKLTAGSKALTATWKAVSGATGYEVQYSTSKKFTKKTTKTVTIKKAKTKKTTIKKLAKGKKYYVRVRAYKTVNGKKIYGAWSSVKSIKVK